MALATGTSACSAALPHGAEDLWTRVIVRNTFIDLAEEAPDGRRPRASSAPAHVRVALPAGGKLGPSWFDRVGPEEAEEDASTESGETASVTGSAVEVDAVSVADSEQACCRAQPDTRSTSAASDDGAEEIRERWADISGDEGQEFRGTPPPPRAPPGTFLGLPVASGGPPCRGARLSSSAKAFTPAAPSAATPPGSRKFRREVEGLANKVKLALAGSCDILVTAEAGYSPQGWFVSVSLSGQNLHMREWLLTQAKQAICGAQLRHSQVIGHCAQPFQQTPLGFAARLGSVPDEEKACWNLLKHGFCQYGDFCHWQHPSAQTVLSVKVNVVAELTAAAEA
ncbi:unnamed protein product [Prorocentrum cordatum]|uniref:C3H1-type domain-containing protein n=1 Tax=Prorocentrum cordatum TaxID=2364126 RepID=A0ABN9R7T7_9DINO|nr:unnamed protein product [Polarella glacialis]|mmetsp:Transcript_90404/g.235340  ORF Transcript_90404/g.235340 Transcript_90404/m.235340 type:complete len:340 (-) Transcript_90404:319-1338(-)